MDPELPLPHMLAADMVIRNAATPLLAAAEARGFTPHPDLPMLEYQLELSIGFMLPA